MNEVTIIDGVASPALAFSPGAALPAHLRQAADLLGSNMPDRITVPSVSYEGKVWQIVTGKDKQKLMDRNSEGDAVPRSVLRVVILGVASRRGRAYYPATYDPGKAAQPDCWSSDGVTPDESVTAPKATACQTCPMAAKGSKITDGKEGVACAPHRILCVVPGGTIDHEPLRLKIAITSDWDKDNTEHGWFAFQQYMDFLKANGIPHSGLVVTKMKFDNNTAYPKILFAVDRFLSEAENLQVIEAVKNPKVEEVIANKFTPAGVNGVIADQSDTAPEMVPGKPDDPVHIAHAGTENELWWNGKEWVKPWLQSGASAAAVAATQAASTAVADIAAQVGKEIDTAAGYAQGAPTTGAPGKPADPAHIAHGGTEHEVWWDGTAWVAPWVKAEAAVVAPAVAPSPPKPPAVEGMAARPAPTDPAHYHLKGQAGEMWWDALKNDWVAPWGPPEPAASAAPINPAVASADPALPADVAQLMQKWA